MKKRALLLVFLLATIGIMAQQVCRRMLINYAGKVVVAYELPQEVDSITFETYNKYFVTALSSDESKGSVTASSNAVEEGKSVTLTATPNDGYEFVNWTLNGEIVSTENPYTATVTANAEFVANFEEFIHEYVDLGLPSGIKWATCNVGANSPEEYGDYFAWGETEPQTTYSLSTYKYCNGSYDTMTKYCTSSSYGTVDNKTVLELEDDAAYVNWGGNWRMPTRAERDELRDTNNCTWTWTTQNGVNGYKVTSVVNGNSIFLPAAGCCYNGSLNNAGSGGYYWSSSLDTSLSDRAYAVFFYSSDVNWYSYGRDTGRSVRAVCESSTPIVCTVTVSATEGGTVEASATEVEEGTSVILTATPAQGYEFVNWTVNGEVVSTENPYTATVTANTEFVANFEIDPYNGHEYVDLGLPSGIKWATCNVGANSPEEYGDYFAWGETEPKTSYNWSTYKYCNGTYNTMTKYCTDSEHGTVDNKTKLELEDDAAYVNWGGNWRMPTIAEYNELISTSNCTWEWTTQNGVNGYKVTSVVNGSSIFLPAAGFRYDGSPKDAGSFGFYWSSSLYTTYSHTAYVVRINSGGVGLSGSYYRHYGQSVRAVYDSSTPIVCTVTVSATEGGEAEASATEVEEGATVTLTATPNAGYRFVNWTVNGEVVSTDRTYLATIIANTEFVANFEEFVPEYVDLGLPSGLKWATCNVGANSPEEYGDYFAWGETEPKDNYSWRTYKYCNGTEDTMTKYCTNSSYGTVDNKTKLELEDDAARVNWGGNWRMPTRAEQDELKNTNNCTWEWTTQNGVNGYKVTSVVNGNSIFLPAAGSRYYGDLLDAGSDGNYWSSSLASSVSYYASGVGFCSSYVAWCSSYRYDGLSVRAVYDSSTPIVCTVTVSATEGGEVEASATEVEEGATVTLTATPAEGYRFTNWTVNGEVVSPDRTYLATIIANTEFVANFGTPLSEPTGTENGYGYVDLGLPSGIKWATYNVGATTPEEYGDYFAWGETEPKDYYDWSTYKYCNGTEYTLTKYCTSSSYGTVDNKTVLELEDDAARVNWGGNWRMPTRAEQDELRNTNNCTWEWTTQNGVNGYIVTSKVNGNSIFLPAAGYRGNYYLSDAGSIGYYWSGSLETIILSNCACLVSFYYNNVGLGHIGRDNGQSVRAVCE